MIINRLIFVSIKKSTFWEKNWFRKFQELGLFPLFHFKLTSVQILKNDNIFCNFLYTSVLTIIDVCKRYIVRIAVIIFVAWENIGTLKTAIKIIICATMETGKSDGGFFP